MAKKFAYRAQMNILQGGYSGEETGVSPDDTSWHETDSLTGSSTHTYYYRDSGCGNNNNSSKVDVNITDTWTCSIDGQNNLTVTVHSVINSIVRGDMIGNPNACGTILVQIRIKRERDGADIAVYPGGGSWMNMADTGTIASNVDLGTYTFTLAPGQQLSRGTVYLYNDAQSGYDDEFEMGISFKNILPADYRPGKIWDGSTWQSHNRSAGFEKIYTSSSATREMRTIDGAEGTGNPPTIYNSDWKNQRKIGDNA